MRTKMRSSQTLFRYGQNQIDDLLSKLMIMDTQRYLPDDILVKVDRAAMAVSLETRMPFLDPRIAEFAWSLPNNYKIRGSTNKFILRKLLGEELPSQLFNVPKKGFGVPLAKWLRTPYLKDWASHLFKKIAGRFRAD